MEGSIERRRFQLSAVLYVQLVYLGHDKFIYWCHLPIPGFQPAYSRHFVPSGFKWAHNAKVSFSSDLRKQRLFCVQVFGEQLML